MIFTCLSWNLHRCQGSDGRVDADRIAHVLATEVWRPGTDALILQEADGECPPHAGLLDPARIEAITGLRYAQHDPAHRWGPESHGFLGVVLYLRPDLILNDLTVLDLPGHCHRGAVVAELSRAGQAFRVIATHLSLSQLYRLAQLRIISQHMFRKTSMPTVLVGDLNEWRPWGGLALSPRLLGQRFEGPAKRSFPAKYPILPLDRVLATVPARVTQLDVLDGDGIRIASDHRPVLGSVRLPDNRLADP